MIFYKTYWIYTAAILRFLFQHMKLEEKTDDAPDKTKYHMPRALHEELSQILKKIGEKTETQQVIFT